MSARDHHVPLPGSGGWSLWRWFVLRSPGFEAARVLRLAVPDLEPRLQRVEAAEREQEIARAGALDAISERIASGDAQTARQLARLRRKIADGATPQESAGEQLGITTALGALRAATHALDTALRELTDHVEQHGPQLASALQHEARDERFREALAWQNPHALRDSVEHLLRQPPEATDSQTRRNAQLVASYLQRYCVKNDTIGFFGPLAWGEVGERGVPLTAEPGARLLAGRTVYFEHWAVDLLARSLSDDPELVVWAMPRRLPNNRVVDGQVRLDGGAAQPLSAAEQWLLAACDGETTAHAIARRCIDEALGIETEDDAYARLRALSARRLISWSFEVPTEVDDPMSTLAALVQRIEDPQVRERATAPIMELARRRDDVAAAAGDSRRVQEVLGELGAAFVRITGASPTRRGGQTYAGRMLVYEDCVRAGQASIGPDLVRWIADPLSALLTSARWFTNELASRYRTLLGRVFRELAPAGEIGLTQFLRAAGPHLTADPHQPPALLRVLRRELAERWSAILADPAAREGGIALNRLVETAFSAPGPGWPLARFHSPDLQIAAASVEDVQRGSFLAVLGELHVGCPTVLAPFFLRHHPTPEALLAARELDLPPPCIAAVTGHETFDRTELTSRCADDLHVEVRDTKSWRPRNRVLAVADLVVASRGDRLEVRTTDGSQRFDIIAFLERYLIALATREFQVCTPAPHTPRVTLGKLVVARETWRFDPGDLTFASRGTTSERFVDAARWARRLRLPRHAFYKVPEETKPCYVDFESPVYVENFARMVRRASAVTLSEMFPGHDALWLADASGHRFTCELRLVAVDPVPWSSPLSERD